MTMQVDTTVKAAPEAVFDAIADARNEPRWNSQVKRSDLRSGEPIGEGTEFETVNRGQPYRAVITTYDRPNRLVYEVSGKQLDITSVQTFEALGDGTVIHADWDFRPKGVFKLLFPVMKGAIRKDMAKQMRSFATFVESP